MELWTGATLGLLPPPKPTRISTVSRCATSAQAIRSFDVESLGASTQPLDVLVPDGAAHQSIPWAARRQAGGVFPGRSFFSAGNGIVVCSPELCFAQLALRLSTADLILLGYELCGKYALCPEAPEGFVERRPLTTAAKLLRFSQALEGRNGAKRARRAAAAVLDGAESPMESKLAAQLCTPTSLGGFALEPASLNEELTVTTPGPHGPRTQTRRCDMLWKDQLLAVEYDSSAHHGGATNIDRDARRRNQLLGRDLVVVTVTKQQVHSFVRMEELAYLLAKLLGTRLRIRVKDFNNRRLGLRRDLLKPDEQLVRPIVHAYRAPLVKNGD